MTRLVAHRGPDDEGLALFGPGRTWTQGDGEPRGDGWNAGLGHRRLSIIDLTAAGHQPMTDAAGRYWIVLNGEIYNFLELRAELEGLGVAFCSHSDTEVALRAFMMWGPECLPRFNGMWALAIYDTERECLFLARDRFGVKPLYYLLEPGRFAFASELKQLHLLLDGTARANRAVLADFLFWRYETHTGDTFFEGLRAFPAGHSAMLTQEDVSAGRMEARPYWSPQAAAALDAGPAAEVFGNLLFDAVRIRLRSDVPVGVTLSGGLDSSSVTCVASRLLRAHGHEQAMAAFTAVFPDPRYSEASYASEVAALAGMRHVFIQPEGGALVKDWSRFVWNMEEPFSSLSFYANWKVYERVAEHGVPVILNGQGGDELLLGYDRYRVPLVALALRELRVNRAIREILGARRHAGMGLLRQVGYLAYFGSPRIRAMRRRRVVRPFLNPEFYAFGQSQTGHLTRESANTDRVDWQLREFFHYQMPHLLRHEDRVSMSFSIESRSPFLDYRLLEFILGQDIELMIRGGWSKALLREAMKGVLPEVVRTRIVKMGFDTPTGRLMMDAAPHFDALMGRNEDDEILNVPALRRAFAGEGVDEDLLCAACSYLSWKETFQVRC